jgi:valyl-tRNA synthetase
MSKSKGNVVTPMGLLEQYGSDAVRYWAAGARPGTDTAFDTGQMKIGRRLAIKVLNASRFALSTGAAFGQVTAALDRALLAELADTVEAATAALDDFDHARALEVTERFFWHFCDDYLELVKARAYGEHGPEAAASAHAGLATALSVLLRLFAPVLPFVTEEVWSWWQEGSVHRAAWPIAAELPAGGDPAIVTAAAEALAGVRKAKSDAKVSMRADVQTATIIAPAAQVDLVEAVRSDLVDSGRIAELSVLGGTGPLTVQVVLAPVED